MSSFELDFTEQMSLIIFLRGKKTYIVGALMIVLGFLQHNTQMILEGFGLITMRAGIANIQPSA